MVLAPCPHDPDDGRHAHEPDAIPAMTSPPEQPAPHTSISPWDAPPPTCGMEKKNRRIARWPSDRDVALD
ncbi:MAG: hypothetical protein U5S82_05345 [Gammaproteobacteria bacterium]|nr:hypothetical protein [Gammaproteobacteria bacterium]